MKYDRTKLFRELAEAVKQIGYNQDAEPLAAEEFTSKMYAAEVFKNDNRTQQAKAGAALRRLLKAGVVERDKRRRIKGLRGTHWVYRMKKK